MKGKIISFDFRQNRVVIEFDSDFSEMFDKFRDKDCEIDIKAWRPKRSGAANRYMWYLVDSIARVSRLPKNEVYRNEIKEIGGVSDVCRMVDESVERFCKHWNSHGIGWQTEVIPIGDGTSNVIAYYGSSTFNTDQMTNLIENLMFEGEQLGINVDTPDRQAWWEYIQEEAKKYE